MNKRNALRLVVLGSLASLPLAANAIYLNQSNMTVSIGGLSTFTDTNNTFNNGATIVKAIDAASALATEDHSQTTHLWFSSTAPNVVLDLRFDFLQQYDLSTLHFWNYSSDSYDVDQINFTFYNGANVQVGALQTFPTASPSDNDITAQNYTLLAPLNVRYVTALLTGYNGEIDFQNMGFTASLSTDRCVQNPNDPICNPTSVPEPGTIALMGLGLLGVGMARRRKAARR
jgi:hypothetical protein